MCGIFGVVVGEHSGLSAHAVRRVVDDLFKLSESRGKEASGVAVRRNGSIQVYKAALPAHALIRRDTFRNLVREAVDQSDPTVIIGHSRLVTNGGQQVNTNNQPAVAGGMVAVHNGIITNVDALWKAFPDLKQNTQLDTEILLDLVRLYYDKDRDLVGAVQKAFAHIEGVASIVALFRDFNVCLLATNNGSMYRLTHSEGTGHVFASEEYILKRLVQRDHLDRAFRDVAVEHVRPGTGCLLDLGTLAAQTFSLSPDAPAVPSPPPVAAREIVDVSERPEVEQDPTRIPGEGPYVLPTSFKDAYPKVREAVARLRRCTRCVLPETMPFIEFDGDGVCNYCRNYRKEPVLGLDALREAMAPYRDADRPDCLVTFSGGRDSSYGVHLVKQELGMNPVTYTYDWGMVTDLARRNQMRICGKLGIEHILVSADITRKRRNIRKNVQAWLRKPVLGTVPLFMAGDKQYFYYANKVSKQTGCRLIILCENMLETTRFKSGFCGIKPRHGSQHTYTLTLGDKFRLAAYYAGQYLRNPRYLNASVIDTIGAFFSYYVIPHEYLNVYRYVQWDEDTINRTLIDDYNWETAPDTASTWRIGDGTAAFYNYIYYALAGLSENDTFRSNQVREGMLTRDQALQLVTDDNQPRYPAMQWYCDVIGVDFEHAIRSINAAPRRYEGGSSC